MAGALVAAAAARGGGEIVPVDSEHSAILQCIAGRRRSEVRRVILTASGGPFRDWTRERARASDGRRMRCGIRRGGWAARSPSTARRSRTRRSRSSRHISCSDFRTTGSKSSCIRRASCTRSSSSWTAACSRRWACRAWSCRCCMRSTHPERVADAGVPPFDPCRALSADVRAGSAQSSFRRFALGIAGGSAGRCGAGGVQCGERAGRRAFSRRANPVRRHRARDRERARTRSAMRRRDRARRCSPPTPRRGVTCRSCFDASLARTDHRLRARGLRSRARPLSSPRSSSGVYAPRFSIGFGPALFRKRRGETEYVLAALPLGGYVRMASRHDAEAAFLEGGSEEARTLEPGRPGLRSERDDAVRAEADSRRPVVRVEAALARACSS